MYSTFTELQDLFPQILAIGHVTTVSRSLTFRIRGRVVWLKSFFRNKNTLAQLHWAKTNFFWHDTKGYGHKNNNAHYQKNTKPACGTRWWQDHSLGLFYFNTKPKLIQGYGAYKNLQIMVSFGISRLLTKENLCDLKLKRTCVMREDNGPKHTSMSTFEWLLKNKRFCVVTLNGHILLENPLFWLSENSSEYKNGPNYLSTNVKDLLPVIFLCKFCYLIYICFMSQYFVSDTWVGGNCHWTNAGILFIYLFFLTISLEGSWGGCSNLSQSYRS